MERPDCCAREALRGSVGDALRQLRQPLCARHAVAQLANRGKKSGKSIRRDCDAAARDYEKSMGGVARKDGQTKEAAAVKSSAPPAKPAAAPTKDAPAPQKSGEGLGAIDSTPGDGDKTIK